MGLYWDIARGTGRASQAVSRAGARAASVAADNRQVGKGLRAAARGVLAPGDPTPPPGSSDFYDYRGVAVARELSGLRNWTFPLGRLIHPRSGTQQEVGLPTEVLDRHAAVIGPTGAGKTKSVLIPWAAAALQGGSSVVMIDVSGDLMKELMVFRRWVGDFNARAGKWDYTDPRQSLSWNWVTAAKDDDAVVSMVESLVGRDRPNDPQPFFQQRDRRILRALLDMQRMGPPATARDLLALLQDQSRLSQQVRNSSASRGARQLGDIISLPPDDYDRAISGVVNAVEALDHPGVEAVTRGAELELDRLFDIPTLLVVGAPLSGSRTSETASALILSQIIRTLYTRFGHSRGTHVYLIVDEAPRLAARLNFEELLSVSRRARVSVCVAAQHVTQFGSQDERDAILGNCGTYVGLPTPSEPTARYLASRLGERVQTSLSLSSNVGARSRDRGTSRSLGSTPVLGIREIMSPPWGERSAVVHSPQVCPKPFLVDLSHDAWR